MLNIETKQEGSPLRASEVNQIVTYTNQIGADVARPSYALSGEDFIQVGFDIIDGVSVPVIRLKNPNGSGNGEVTKEAVLTALGAVNGVLPLEIMPGLYIIGMTGTGTETDPYIVQTSGGGGNDLKSLPGYSTTGTQMLYNVNGAFQWGAVPTGGSAGKLDPTTITVGTPSSNGIPLSLAPVAHAVTYEIQRLISGTYIQIYSGTGLTFTDTGLTPSTQYSYRARSTAAGYDTSDWSAIVTATTAAPGAEITPPAPTAMVVNDTVNTANWTYAIDITSVSDYEYTVNSGTSYVQAVAKPISVGDVSLPAGTFGIRVKAIPGTRTASATLFNTVPFTKVPVTPAAPTNMIVNDTANTADWTYVAGYLAANLYEYSIDNGVTIVAATVKPISVGDVYIPAGFFKIRVKAGAENNASPWLSSTVAFTQTPVTTQMLTDVSVIENGTITDNNITFIAPSGQFGRALFNYKFSIGATGFIQFDARQSETETAGVCLDHNFLNNGDTGVSQLSMYMGAQNKFLVKVGNSYDYNFDPNPNLPVDSAGNVKGRMRLTGAVVYFEYSTDGGVTWITGSQAPQPQEVLFLKSVGNPGATTRVYNLRGYNVESV